MKLASLPRRELLKALASGAIGLAGVAAGASQVAAQTSPADTSGELIGPWRVAFTSVQTGQLGRATVVFIAGGAVLNVQEDFPTAGLGTWNLVGAGTATFRIAQWDYRGGMPPFLAVMQGQVQGSNDRSSIVGSYTSEVSRDGVVVETGSFTFVGLRVYPS